MIQDLQSKIDTVANHLETNANQNNQAIDGTHENVSLKGAKESQENLSHEQVNRCECQFDVKEIIDERKKRQKGREGKKEYLVEWKHTWIPEENLDCSAALKRFLRALNYLKKLKIKRLNDLKNKRQKEEQKTIRSNKTNVLNK